MKEFKNCVVHKDETGYPYSSEYLYRVYVGKNFESLIGIADKLNFERYFNIALDIVMFKFNSYKKSCQGEFVITCVCEHYEVSASISDNSLYLNHENFFEIVNAVLLRRGIHLYWTEEDYFAVMQEKNMIADCNGGVRICKYDGQANSLFFAEWVV